MKRLKYLALVTLLAFGACDNGGGNTVATVVTGTISGTVSIEGTGASGVTVTLSSGSTATTDGSGNYSFSNVPAGAYTVSISGYPSDATFSTSAKAAVITTSGQVVTADFSGSYIRTSAIIGSVKDGSGAGLSGVTVSISGQGTSASNTTDNTGQTAPFTGLRAGSYTVTISGYDATNYTCATTSQSVTLATGELQVVPFTCTLKTTASISGSLFLDEGSATPDSVFESGIESKLAVANVPILLEGGTVNDTTTVMTDANGDYTFPNLAAGTYRVTYQGTAADVPGNVAFSGVSSEIVTITSGATATVNFPFLITQQAIKVYAFLGGNVAPISGWKMDLYDTQADARAGLAAGKLSATVATDATGAATFRFDRSADSGPNGTPPDGIVFARSNALPSALYTMTSSSGIVEIHYPSMDSVTTAPDTLAALYGQVVVKMHTAETDNDTITGWRTQLRAADSTSAASNKYSDGNGDVYYTLTPASLLALNGAATSYPYKLYVRLAGAQNTNGHGFIQTPSATDATAAGRALEFTWDGTTLPSDTVDLGSEMVSYTDANLYFQVHHEMDDSTSVPTFTGGDDVSAAHMYARVDLYKVHADGTKTKVGSSVAPDAATGMVVFLNQPTDSTYEVHARSTDTTQVVVLNDSVVTATVGMSDSAYVDSTLAGSAGASSFAIKSANDTIKGAVKGHDGTRIDSVVVTLTPTSDNIQGSPMMVDTTGATGVYTFPNLREGPYQVSVADIAGEWQFFDTVAGNIDAHTAVRDPSGFGDRQNADFVADRMNTKISGLIFNDRDKDNTQDPTDALVGAVVDLFQGGTLIAADTTDSKGAYSFSNLREGTYTVAPVAGTPNSDQSIVRALNVTTDTATTTASADYGSTTPAKLPEWDYSTTAPVGGTGSAADFLFLANNTVATGVVQDSVSGKGVAGMTISLRRCDVSVGAAKPPKAEDLGPDGIRGTADDVVACQSYLGTTATTVTDSTGTFTFNNLQEGVYEITPQPGTVGSYTFSDPVREVYLQQNPGDVESNKTTPFTVGHP